MPLAAGTRLGPYEILAPLGAGGMGEVYRARDTRLDRAVALKVLPEEFFEDHDRVARFEREAKALAALNHPRIAAVHSFEAVAGRRLLVMELVEGAGLDARIAGGAIALEEALPIARQVAEALEAAHAFLPFWRSDGKELYYQDSERRLTAVEVRARDAAFEWGPPQPLFSESAYYRVQGGGDRFLKIEAREIPDAPLTLLLDWRALLAPQESR